MKTAPKRVVFVAAVNPFEHFGGSRIRDSHLIRLLLERFDVEVLCFEKPAHPHRGTEPEIHAPHRLTITALPAETESLPERVVSPLRPRIARSYSTAYASELKKRLAPDTLVWISRLTMAKYAPIVSASPSQLVIDTHQVDSHILLDRALSSLSELGKIPMALQCFWLESRYCQMADAIVATSDIDASRLKRLLGPSMQPHIWTIPKSVDVEVYRPIRGSSGSTVFFSGTLDYRQNIEGLDWFIQTVLPVLRAHAPTLPGGRLPRLVAAGMNPSAEAIERWEEAGFEVHANPASILPDLKEAAVVIVPIVTGGGTRLKVLEAMAAGKSVVSTGRGARGLSLAPSYDLEISDNSNGFAASVMRLLKDEALRTEIGKRASKTIEERFDFRQHRAILANLLDSI